MWRVLGAMLVVLSCGTTPIDRARETLLVIARAGDAADAALAPAYTRAASDALRTAETVDAYRATMAPWDDAVAVVAGLREAVRGGWSAVRAAEILGTDAVLGAVRCALAAVARVVAALGAVGIDAPRSVRDALDLVDAVGGMECRA